jgi:hypothetical protein
MSLYLACFLSLFLLADADIPRINSLRPATGEVPLFDRGDEIALFPAAVDAPSAASSQQSLGVSGAPGAKQAASPSSLKLSGTLQENSKLLLIRYVSGELAKATKTLPAGKDGFIVFVGNPPNAEQLERAVATHGAAIKSGDNVQISKLEFQKNQIVVDLNGGGRGKTRLRDRIHLEMSGMPSGQVTSTNSNADPDAGPAGIQPGKGTTLFIDFNRPVPDLSPDDLKTLLSPYLDFNKQRSASVQWIDTLPPDIKKAIQERHPMLGMDRDMVVAAVGKPDHKVRERDADGNDIEDWIYGQPPSKTIFVRFTGDHVSSIKQFPK